MSTKSKKILIGCVMVLLFFIAGVLASQFYERSQSKKFLGCEHFLSNIEVDNRVFSLMEEKKYKEVVALGNKHLKDDELWYCDNYFWIQRAKAFYNLGDCVPTLIASLHAIYVTPIESNKPQKEFYDFVSNSDICVIKH